MSRYRVIQRNSQRNSRNSHNQTPNTNRRDSFDKWGTYSERIALCVGIIVAVITLYLFNEARKSTEAAVKAANAAELTYREQRAKDSTDTIGNYDKELRAKLQFNIDTANQRKQFDIQVSSLKDAKQRFEEENESYLQLSSFDTVSFRRDDYPVITYWIDNLGQPAKITEGYMFAYTDAPNVDVRVIKKRYKNIGEPYIIQNTFITRETPQKETFFWREKLPSINVDAVKNGTAHIYFFGKFKYQDLITKNPKGKVYEFIIEFNLSTKGYKYLEANNLP